MKGFTNFERGEYCYEEGCARGADGFRIGNLCSNQLTPGAVKQFPGVSHFYQQIVGLLSFSDSLFRRGYPPHTERNP